MSRAVLKVLMWLSASFGVLSVIWLSAVFGEVTSPPSKIRVTDGFGKRFGWPLLSEEHWWRDVTVFAGLPLVMLAATLILLWYCRRRLASSVLR